MLYLNNPYASLYGSIDFLVSLLQIPKSMFLPIYPVQQLKMGSVALSAFKP